MNPRPLLLFAATVFAGAGLALLLMRERSSTAPTGRGSELGPPNAVASVPESSSSKLDVGDPQQELAATESGTGSRTAVSVERKPSAPKLATTGSDPFARAAELMADPFYNPQRRNLTKEQRHELQGLLDQANAKARELAAAEQAQVEAHSRELIARGDSRPAAEGEKIKLASGLHTVINLGAGSQEVSFAGRDVPEIAAIMDARVELVKSTTEQIQAYFSAH
jgi:hypothetical protein